MPVSPIPGSNNNAGIDQYPFLDTLHVLHGRWATPVQYNNVGLTDAGGEPELTPEISNLWCASLLGTPYEARTFP